MTSQNTTSVTAHMVACGACNQHNSEQAAFCDGCGEILVEPCPGCNEQVRLTQKFCGGCGENLVQALDTFRGQCQRWLEEAISRAESHEYDRALALLSQAAGRNDHRFRDLAENARDARQKMERLRDQAVTKADATAREAELAFHSGDHQRVTELLDEIPIRLMDPGAKRIHAESTAFLANLTELRQELQAALSGKDYPRCGSLLDELIELQPDSSKYRRLAAQVADKLMKSAARRCDRQDYRGANERLDAVPTICHDETYERARRKTETVRWLSEQFDSEPFATPALGRLAVRFAKESPRDPVPQQLISQLAEAIKRGPEDRREGLPKWRGQRQSWLGGPLGYLATPQSIDSTDVETLQPNPGRFAVAFGLALQGLGLGRVNEQFLPRKSLLASLSGKSLKSRTKRSCWGVDVGACGVRAIQLAVEKSAERPFVKKVYAAEFETPTCRGEIGHQESSLIAAGIEQMLQELDLGDADIWANLSPRSSVSRFVRLPPVKDKQAQRLVEDEIRRNIPMDMTDLSLIRWIAPLNESDQHGRPAMIAAAKKSVVDQRVDLLTHAGLKPTGLQGEAVSLVNYLSYEFAGTLAGKASSSDSSKTPAVALIDAGATHTVVLIVSSDDCWHWTIESGGEKLTSALARATRRPRADAESLKRNPSALKYPREMFQPVEQVEEELRARLEAVVNEAVKQNGRFDVVETWCTGGNCLTHGWIRRVLQVN